MYIEILVSGRVLGAAILHAESAVDLRSSQGMQEATGKLLLHNQGLGEG